MASPNTHRNVDTAALDFYTSPPDFVHNAIRYIKSGELLWEPSVGTGKVAKPLEELGFSVHCSDIYDYGYINKEGKPTEVQDFLSIEYAPFFTTTIITNPPYKGAQKYVEHALSLLESGGKVIMLLRLDFLTSQSRGKFFKEVGQLKHVDIFSYRIKCLKDDIDDGKSSAVNYAIFVWEVGYTGQPIIDWITK
ncbi:MAG: hypothetical protein ACRCUJ_07530 [Phocaeicola sp.]